METTGGFGLTRIGQIFVRARDIDRAVAFYRDRLGIPFLFQVPKMAFFQCGEVRLLLSKAEPEFDHPSSVLYFTVEDLDGAYRTLGERGVAFRGEPHLIHRAEDHDLWMAFFNDSEENTHALMAQRPKS